MHSTVYLIRHAQSSPSRSRPPPEWPLSEVGKSQANRLAELLSTLDITHAYSSPFVRSLGTAAPFVARSGLELRVLADLRERTAHQNPDSNHHELWCRSWEDFSFAPPAGENSTAAMKRICCAVQGIAAQPGTTSAVFTHGHVIGLFLHALDETFGREEAERLTNPDVLRIRREKDALIWERDFKLEGLARFSTGHGETPTEQEA